MRFRKFIDPHTRQQRNSCKNTCKENRPIFNVFIVATNDDNN